jgi:serine/threonine protein kinase
VGVNEVGLRKLIGQGGMSAVYEGYQVNLRRPVAVKVLKPELSQQEQHLARFNDEAEIAAQLSHPHIAHIYDYGIQDGISYIVMQLLRGGSLWDRMRSHLTDGTPVMTPLQCSTLLKQVSGALDYAHSKGVIHRDIKPSNIMFDDYGPFSGPSMPLAFIVDFGIALLQHRRLRATRMRDDDTLMGTFAYISPEMWQGESVAGAADQYALGLIVYSLLTGHAPYDAGPNDEYRMRSEHLNTHPIPVHLIRSDVSELVSKVISRAIAKRPEQRFHSIRAFSEAFESALRGLDTTHIHLADSTTRRFLNLRKSPALRRNDAPSPIPESLPPAFGEAEPTKIAQPHALNTMTDDHLTRNLRPQYDLNLILKRKEELNARIFLSYRPEDSAKIAERIGSRLKMHFGSKAVFSDLEQVPLGANVKKHYKQALQQEVIALVLVGNHWMSVADPGRQRRIDRPNDPLRMGLEAALEAGIPIIPLFVEGAEFPPVDDVPDSLRDILHHKGAIIRPEPEFHDDLSRLIEQLDPLLRTS